MDIEKNKNSIYLLLFIMCTRAIDATATRVLIELLEMIHTKKRKALTVD